MVEYLDIVDESDKNIGKGTRKNIHLKNLIHRGIHVFILNKKGELLIQRRSLKKDDRPGYYDASIGAQVLSGESYEQAAIREAKEELGLQIKKTELREICYYNSYSDRQKENRRLFLVYNDGPLGIDKSEVASAEFWTISKIKQKIKEGKLHFTEGFLMSFQKFLESQTS